MSKVLELSERHGFVIPVIINGIVDHLRYGPLGELLAQNICREWIYSNVTHRDQNVYLYHSESKSDDIRDLKDEYRVAFDLNNGHLPFGLATYRKCSVITPACVEGDGRYFHPANSQCFRYIAFTTSSEGPQFFYRWQQQRKMWWRKFSTNPGQFSLTETKSEGEAEKAHISAKFPWGEEVIETLTNHGRSIFNDLDSVEKSNFEARDGRKRTLPYVVESTARHGTAVMTFLCDAYSEPSVLGITRRLLHFHRKLAPYKTSFAAAPADSSTAEEIRQLAEYLTQGLHKNGLPTLIASSNLAKKSLESQLALNDALGIPYTVVLSLSTLSNGIAGLRSRETTLEEQVHVSKLVEYMEQLMRNY